MSLVLLTAGCATNLTTAKVKVLTPGSTSSDYLPVAFGKPRASQTEGDPTGTMSLDTFVEYEQPAIVNGMKSSIAVLLVESRNNVVSGYILTSNNGENTTHFDETQTKYVVVNSSKRDDVRSLLGEPNGRVLVPSKIKEVLKVVRPNTKEVWVYSTINMSGLGLRFGGESRALYVAFDADGSVQNFLVSKEKLGA